MSSFFLWPMIIPLIIPIIYCIKWKRENLKDIWLITLVMILIIVLYQPLVWNLDFPVFGYAFWKFVLFVFMPIGVLSWHLKTIKITDLLGDLGLRKEGTRKSLSLFALLLPVMLATEVAVSILLDRSNATSDLGFSALMFLESFTEEFFFRGILFLFLWKITDLRVAYATSIMSFVLMHPQYFWGIGMVAASVQGVLTAVISHKSRNLTGAWVLHGANRVFSLSVLPLWL